MLDDHDELEDLRNLDAPRALRERYVTRSDRRGARTRCWR